MLRNGLAVVVLGAGLSLARDPGCGGGGDPAGGTNAPCTRSKDCSGDLVCQEGVCVEPSDGGTPKDASDERG